MYEIVPRTLREQPTLVVRGRVCAEHIGTWLADAYRSIGDHAAKTGARFTGPPFASFKPLDTELLEFEIEAGFPVVAATPGGGDVVSSTLPGGTAATTLHVGPYELLGRAHEAVDCWVAEHGVARDTPCWEVYYSDPMSEPDATQWRTEIVQPYL